MRVVVCTIVHHPADARIYHRQIRALLDAGHQVTYIAPVPGFSGRTGGARAAAHRRPASRRAAQARRPALGPQGPGRARGPGRPAAHPRSGAAAGRALAAAAAAAVWDVHEDTAAALSTKPWLPRPLRPPAALAVHTAERLAERYMHLILAEQGYAARFPSPHPVVPNTTYVPDEPAPSGGDRRVVYLGHLSPDRGTAEMIELARQLRPHGITVELIGAADRRARAQIEPAQAEGLLRWHGFVPNDRP